MIYRAVKLVSVPVKLILSPSQVSATLVNAYRKKHLRIYVCWDHDGRSKFAQSPGELLWFEDSSGLITVGSR